MNPTNHLDLESINALNISLSATGYGSAGDHDHDLIDEVPLASALENQSQDHDFKGSYEEYQTVHA